ncbi:hypothetical protein CXF67_15535 [Psychroflexus sp. MES1-P1E]|nr:hypothetical protein CXF67_15535 [Psychroflexus sp. MES1-P1E]
MKNKFRFYDFLKKYVEYKGGNNEERKTKGYKNFKAIIDGQQRLNSLYIGLKGSYAYKNYVYKKKKYREDEINYPSRNLFLDILNPIENDENKKVYDFKFLIYNNHKKDNEKTTKRIVDENDQEQIVDCFWFGVSKILEFTNEHSVVMYLSEHKLDIGGFPGETLLKLFKLINEKPIINFYLEKDQNFDKVLYEFIRTNSGGTTLSFADLLMSIITASWEKGKSSRGAREEIDSLIRQIKEIGFNISQDFVLKTSLVMFSSDIKFKLKNFDSATIQKIKEEWGVITLCIKSTFELIKSLSFNNHSLRAKNAAIPIIYFLYKSKLYENINKENQNIEHKVLIKKYLHISLLNKLFGGSSDGFLKKIKTIVSENETTLFPLENLKLKFKGTNRSFYMDDEKIDAVLQTSYDSLDSFYVLSILFPSFNFEFKNPNIDHMHPKSQFNEANLKTLKDDETREFYLNYYNTILNLTLLSEELNKSKNKSELKKWIFEQENHNGNIRNTLQIPEKIDLDFLNFQEFISEREVLLKGIIKRNIE